MINQLISALAGILGVTGNIRSENGTLTDSANVNELLMNDAFRGRALSHSAIVKTEVASVPIKVEANNILHCNALRFSHFPAPVVCCADMASSSEFSCSVVIV